jgi:hypothetical protein
MHKHAHERTILRISGNYGIEVEGGSDLQESTLAPSDTRLRSLTNFNRPGENAPMRLLD